MRLAIVGVLVAACGAPHDSTRTDPPRNVVTTTTVHVAPTDPFGWIGFAPSATNDSDVPSYLPRHVRYPLVLAGDATRRPYGEVRLPLPASGRVVAVGTSGGGSTYTAHASMTVPFGCDGNTLEVTPFTGRPLPPGPAWVLPAGAPSTWSPQGHAPRVVSATSDRARFELGPLEIELVRRTPSEGDLVVKRGTRTVYSAEFTRTAIDGADPASLTVDLLDRDTPGIPSPIGGWTIAPGGPILVVFHTPSWEGSHLTALLVDDEHANAVLSLAQYLYRCAF
ncbi:MAG TPA: hypothetical protein VM513_16355 [Kofleriaceae bacterium]|nr:hypothetical protein [Kofleriaceae bacterium]